MSIQKHLELNFKKINYDKPVKQGLIYYSSINYDNEPFYIQSPKMICKEDGSFILDKKNTMINLETINHDYSFYDFFINFDDKNIKETYKNNNDWFNKEIPLEIIDNMYKRTCKPIKKNSKPTFSFKIPTFKDKVQCQIYDQKKNYIDFNKIKSGSELSFILHIPEMIEVWKQ